VTVGKDLPNKKRKKKEKKEGKIPPLKSLMDLQEEGRERWKEGGNGLT